MKNLKQPTKDYKYKVMVCQGPSCNTLKSEKLRLEIEKKVLEAKLDNIRVDFTGCHGFCQQGPIIVVEPEGILYCQVKIEDINDIVTSHLKNGKPVARLHYVDPGTNKSIPKYKDINFYKKQKKIILRNCGQINPERIDDYIERDGYAALKKVLSEMSQEKVIEEIKKSGLRGRGGAGFHTGLKWEFCYKSEGDEKYLICNADEGDPGAFMDRGTLEGDPHSIIEGMIIAAYTIGANKCYIYCRTEYPLAIKRIKIALKQAEEHGFIGKNILNSGFDCQFEIKEGAGVFVCGEETALMASIEGKRGMPNPRPPYPAQSGLWGKPTNINNVKTFAAVPVIINKGAKWFSQIGTEKCKGTVVFALTGKIANSGLIEVPMGTTLYDIIFDIGGGISGGKKFKAVQTGGPSGGCLPASFLNSPVDYETLASAGSIMGSGGMVVLDEDTCMVDVAKYFLTFTMMESCGKCIPCRWGNKQLLEILEDITNGMGTIEDIDLLIELSHSIKSSSLCGLGQTSPNPVLSTIRYFRHEYESHIINHYCEAAVCKGLVDSPCSHTCPVGIDVPRYIRYISEEKFVEGIKVIQESMPFPAICGYVCFNPCEAKCRRGLLDEPIAIRDLKRFLSDSTEYYKKDVHECSNNTGKKVAIVGSGPAGLTAAYYLRKICGHEVTILEALPKAGGMLRVGIPRYRLPEKILDAEISTVENLGVDIIKNTKVNSIENLKKQGYDAIFLAIGTHIGLKLRIPGEDAPGVIDCIKFLRDINLGNPMDPGKKVAVIGGGNAAIDAARSALRVGAKEVFILYRRTHEEMPASEEEIEDAVNEGIKIEFLTAPKKITQKDNKLILECIRMKLGDIDSSGRKTPEEIPGSEYQMEFDTIITAIGQTIEMPDKLKNQMNRNGSFKTDLNSSKTNIEGIFAGGDMVTGPRSVIEAIAFGKIAASSIDKFLGGTGDLTEKLLPEKENILLLEIEMDDNINRVTSNKIKIKKRLNDFRLVDKGLNKKDAIKEANRCLRCDLEKN